jgi:hypothetical protein
VLLACQPLPFFSAMAIGITHSAMAIGITHGNKKRSLGVLLKACQPGLWPCWGAWDQSG